MTDTVETKDLETKDLEAKDLEAKDLEAKNVEAKNTESRASNMETHSALPPEETERLSGEIVAALKTVFDPEIPADIYELGLIYKVDLKDDRSVDLMMTLTTPNCPAAGELPQMVENAVASVPGVGVVNVNLVWDPAWTPDRMSDEARLVLNMW
jgi:FeS assembly SUF system protein